MGHYPRERTQIFSDEEDMDDDIIVRKEIMKWHKTCSESIINIILNYCTVTNE